jgi:hypothetical protein
MASLIMVSQGSSASYEKWYAFAPHRVNTP